MVIEIKNHLTGKVIWNGEEELLEESLRRDNPIGIDPVEVYFVEDCVRYIVPVIKNIDKSILVACSTDGCKLDMYHWHKNSTCGTVHCRAGWAIHLAGLDGYMLEERFGPRIAGSLIYAVSRPHKPIPNFYIRNEEVITDIQACAAEDT